MLPLYLLEWQERQPYEDEENETGYRISEENAWHSITFCLV